MTRLSLELHRLYLPLASGTARTDSAVVDPQAVSLVDGQGRVRALVLGLCRPAEWAALSRVWHGVQDDLDLPAPAIAVNGRDGQELWFSLAEPVPAQEAQAFVSLLRARYLGEVKAQRVALWPTTDDAQPPGWLHARPVPAQQPGGGAWSAFVAPDLAAVFSDEPWLDLPPSPEGQAKLLAGLKCMAKVDFQRALVSLQPVAAGVTESPQPLPGPAPATPDGTPHPGAAPVQAWTDPQRFLLDIMNNDSVDLALRIEAAKALLPCAAPARPA